MSLDSQRPATGAVRPSQSASGVRAGVSGRAIDALAGDQGAILARLGEAVRLGSVDVVDRCWDRLSGYGDDAQESAPAAGAWDRLSPQDFSAELPDAPRLLSGRMTPAFDADSLRAADALTHRWLADMAVATSEGGSPETVAAYLRGLSFEDQQNLLREFGQSPSSLAALAAFFTRADGLRNWENNGRRGAAPAVITGHDARTLLYALPPQALNFFTNGGVAFTFLGLFRKGADGRWDYCYGYGDGVEASAAAVADLEERVAPLRHGFSTKTKIGSPILAPGQGRPFDFLVQLEHDSKSDAPSLVMVGDINDVALDEILPGLFAKEDPASARFRQQLSVLCSILRHPLSAPQR